MCAISGSFSKNKLKELYKLNAYRGEMNHSLTTFEYDPKLKKIRTGVMYQGKGGLPDFLIDGQDEAPSKYFLSHSQAPTTEASSIHPASSNGALLWHNGIIKQSTIEPGAWDTEWMIKQIVDYGWSSLSRVNGTFACVMYNENKLYVFRNEISPLYIDDTMNISSTRFEGSRQVIPNVVWEFSLKSRNYWGVADFETFENPYFFA